MQRLPAPSSVIAASVLAPFAASPGELLAFVAQGAESRVPDGARDRLGAALDTIAPKQRKLMGRSAELSVALLHGLVTGLAATDAPLDWASMGFFAGVGASDARLDDFERLVRASLDGDVLDYARLGTAGLAACHPLFAFRIMNNFTLAHPAIAEGVSGPNAAFFSRGAVTAEAFVEAAWAVHECACAHAIVLGADSALHSLTLAEAAREGSPIEAPSEAAAGLVLGGLGDPRAIATLFEVRSQPIARAPNERGIATTLAWAIANASSDEAFVVVADAPAERARLVGGFRERSSHVFDVVGACGTTLAAGPAVGVVLAVALLHAEDAASRSVRRVSVLTLDADGRASSIRLGRQGGA